MPEHSPFLKGEALQGPLEPRLIAAFTGQPELYTLDVEGGSGPNRIAGGPDAVARL